MWQVWLQGRTTCSRGEETSIDFWHTLQMMGEAGQPKCQKGGGGITQSWRLLMARDGNRPLFSLTEIEYSGNSLFVQWSIGFWSRLHGSHLRLPERGKHGHLPDVKEGYCFVLFLDLTPYHFAFWLIINSPLPCISRATCSITPTELTRKASKQFTDLSNNFSKLSPI